MTFVKKGIIKQSKIYNANNFFKCKRNYKLKKYYKKVMINKFKINIEKKVKKNNKINVIFKCKIKLSKIIKQEDCAI
jgi:hypothetical protein